MYLFLCLFFFFFKQKTAYEMSIGDWSSDVCSSDLLRAEFVPASRAELVELDEAVVGGEPQGHPASRGVCWANTTASCPSGSSPCSWYANSPGCRDRMRSSVSRVNRRRASRLAEG